MTTPTTVSGGWLRAHATQTVFSMLTEAGYMAFVVGGCVRDTLLDRPVSDVDFATDAHPDTVMELASARAIKALPTGIDHGTVTLVIDGRGFEVTTFREDIRTDGRRAVVSFADSPETDATRRDFTINAIYADHAGRILDPADGLADIPARRIRFIGDPDARISEDALRILRFFRFFAQIGDPTSGPDADGLAACAKGAPLLDRLSSERIGSEMRKLLSAPNPAPALASMQAAGVLHQVLPGAEAANIAPLVHVERDRPPRWLRRLAALGGHDPRDRLRLSNAELRALQATRSALESDPLDISRNAYWLGADAATDAALIASASMATLPPDDLEAQAETGATARFPVRASDFEGRIAPGPELGKALKRLEKAWVTSGFSLSRDELLRH